MIPPLEALHDGFQAAATHAAQFGTRTPERHSRSRLESRSVPRRPNPVSDLRRRRAAQRVMRPMLIVPADDGIELDRHVLESKRHHELSQYLLHRPDEAQARAAPSRPRRRRRAVLCDHSDGRRRLLATRPRSPSGGRPGARRPLCGTLARAEPSGASTQREGPRRAQRSEHGASPPDAAQRGSSQDDNDDNRVIKWAHDPTSGHAVPDAYTLYVFSSLEERRTPYNTGGSGDYDISDLTEVPYLGVEGDNIARVVYEPDVPESSSAAQHVFYELGDHLGSTSTVLDKTTGELVEKATYAAYGAADSDYRPGRWGDFREDYRFTGKEDDVEVGLTYFGKRFYSPSLGRWMNPDPLALHEPGKADLNLYAYVHGRVLSATDPMGLEDDVNDFGGTTSVTHNPDPGGNVIGETTIAVGRGAGDADAGIADAGAGSNLAPGGTGPGEYADAYSGQATAEVTAHFASAVQNAANGAASTAKAFSDTAVETGADVLTSLASAGGARDANSSTVPAAAWMRRYMTFGSDGLTYNVAHAGFTISAAIAMTIVAPEKGAAGEAAKAEGAFSKVLNFTERDLQKGFTKHGEDFGLSGNWNPSRAADFSRAVNMHINDAAVVEIAGTYRGVGVTHFFNPATGVNVIATPGGQYVSGWQLGVGQLENLLRSGALQ